jgi:hypothetical protein
MKRINQWLALASVATLCLSVGNLMAQDQGGPGGQRGQRGQRGSVENPKPPGDAPAADAPGGRGNRGNFDPAQMQQRGVDRIKEQFGSTDQEWAAIEPLVKKVMDLRREQMMGGMRGGFGRGGQGGPAVTDPKAEVTAQAALAKAIEGNADKKDLQAKMAAVRKDRDAKQDALTAAQNNLKKVLNTKQEAIALQRGLVN